MLRKFLKNRLLFPIVLENRSISIQSSLDLGNEMKLLNDRKQYEETLKLLDHHSKQSNEMLSSQIITQALKACTHLGDIQRGKTIHQLISSHLKDDSYILASLIYFYS
jgi:hypothetical protein